MAYLCALVYVAALYARPAEIIPALSGVPVIDYLSIACALAAVLSLAVRPRKFWDQPHDKLFLVYWLTIVVSNPAWGWMGGAQLAFTEFLPVAFCYFLIRIGVQNSKQLSGLIGLLVALNLFLAVNGLLQVFVGAGIGQVAALDTREGIRIQGTGIFNDPNDLGMTLVMTVPFLLTASFGSPVRFLTRVVSFAGLLTVLTACYYTNSRGTILGLGTVFAVYAYRRAGYVAATMLAAVAVAGLVALGPSRMSNVSAGEASAQGRIQAWAAGFGMFRSSPVFGIGYGRYADVHERAAHNAFMHVLGELGIVGAVSFVGLFYWYFESLRKRDSNEPAALPAAVPRPIGAAMLSRRLPSIASFASSPPTLGVRPLPAFHSIPTPPYANGRTRPAEPVVRAVRTRLNLRNDLADSGIGLIACMCFLSRQYTVVVFIVLALGACYAAQRASGGPAAPPFRHTGRILALTFGLYASFYVVVRLFAFY